MINKHYNGERYVKFLRILWRSYRMKYVKLAADYEKSAKEQGLIYKTIKEPVEQLLCLFVKSNRIQILKKPGKYCRAWRIDSHYKRKIFKKGTVIPFKDAREFVMEGLAKEHLTTLTKPNIAWSWGTSEVSFSEMF